MIEVKERPQEGQFIVIWDYNGKPWSNTCRITNGNILAYHDRDNKFYFVDEATYEGLSGLRYFIADRRESDRRKS